MGTPLFGFSLASKRLSETLEGGAESLPGRVARNATLPPDFFPGKAFQAANDDIFCNCITGCQHFVHEHASFRVIPVRVSRPLLPRTFIRIFKNRLRPLPPPHMPHERKKEIAVKVVYGRLSAGRILPESLGNGSGCFFK